VRKVTGEILQWFLIVVLWIIVFIQFRTNKSLLNTDKTHSEILRGLNRNLENLLDKLLEKQSPDPKDRGETIKPSSR